MNVACKTLCAICAIGACAGPADAPAVFVGGRAVEPVGDSLLAVTAEGVTGLVLINLNTGVSDTVAGDVLESAVHVQHQSDRWYVSDLAAGEPSIAVLESTARSGDVTLASRIDLTGITTLPHQFAVLPNDEIVLEAPDARLVVWTRDSVATFALTESGPRPSLLVAARGGALHAVPDRHITLYNQFGHIRWRIDWPWLETAFVTDIAVDAPGRIHFLAGISSQVEGTFVVYTMVGETGEIVRWSTPGPYATFVVSSFGQVRPDSISRWF